MSDVVTETRIVLSAWVPVELADALRERAILEERTVSAEIRRLIKASFNSEAPAVTPRLREDVTGQGHDGSE